MNDFPTFPAYDLLIAMEEVDQRIGFVLSNFKALKCYATDRMQQVLGNPCKPLDKAPHVVEM